jgi:hypothetical protein
MEIYGDSCQSTTFSDFLQPQSLGFWSTKCETNLVSSVLRWQILGEKVIVHISLKSRLSVNFIESNVMH